MKQLIFALKEKWISDTTKKLPLKAYFLYTSLGVVLAVFLTLLFNLTGFINFGSFSETSRNQFGVFDSKLMLFLLYCVFTPFVEEIVFRFVIFNSLYIKLKKAQPAILISTALFAVYHMNPVQGLYAFILGLYICISYHRSGSFFVPYIVHASANLVALACTIFFL